MTPPIALWRAAALYLADKAPLLVLSGGTRVEGALPDSHLMAEKLALLDFLVMPWCKNRKAEPRERTGSKPTRYCISAISNTFCW